LLAGRADLTDAELAPPGEPPSGRRQLRGRELDAGAEMNSGFSTDHERLTRHAGEFGGLAERAGQIAGDLNHTLDALGKPWGDDEVGHSFAAVHTGPAEETRTRPWPPHPGTSTTWAPG